MKWKPVVNTHQCTFSNVLWLKLWWLKVHLQLKLIAECRLFMMMTMLTWVLCITGLKSCKDDKPGRLYLCVQEQNGPSAIATDEFHMSKLDKLIKAISKSFKGKLLSILAFYRNDTVILLMFFNIGRLVQDGFLTCWWQRWKFQERKFASNCHNESEVRKFFTTAWQQGVIISLWIIITKFQL